MDEEEVQVVLLQLLEHLPGRLLHIWGCVVAVVQLCIRTQVSAMVHTVCQDIASDMSGH